MFDLQIIKDQSFVKFNHQIPIFNWPYPLHRDEDLSEEQFAPYTHYSATNARRRAVYIHVPFCDTICNFCPFSRVKRSSDEEIERYVQALIAEMDMKREFLGRPKIDAVFVGGGTPSLLNPQLIASLGRALARNFDLSSCHEFTFEVEVKSVSPDKVEAMHDIGVNRVSFGAQTFVERYRTLFGLDATAAQINSAAALLTNKFTYTNVDILYGMAGQSTEDVSFDVTRAVALGTTTIDVYPLNNLSATKSMHIVMTKAGLDVLPEAERVQFRVQIKELFHKLGYVPISGYGFSPRQPAYNPDSSPIQHFPKFLYHDLVYGYHDDEILGYGCSALSRVGTYNVYNVSHRQSYIVEVLENKALPHFSFGPLEAPERGIVTFPFRGNMAKARIPWSRISDEIVSAMREAVDAKLIVDRGEEYVVNDAGWLFYVNLMYYFMPRDGKKWISTAIGRQIEGGHVNGDTDLSRLL